MQYRDLGKTGMRVSMLGLGTVKFGRTEGLRYPAGPLPSMRDIADLLAVASELGVNLIDTAPAYGVSEERLGALLGTRRHDWIVCTKVGETFEAGGSRYDFTPEHTRTSVLRSLRRLATDHLDVVLVHSDGNDADIIERHGALQALAELKRDGLIRAFGLSHKTAAGGMRAAEICDVVMTTLNVDQLEELPVIAHADAHGCGVLVKKPLNSGAAARDSRRLRLSLTIAARTPGVSSIVVGTTNPRHLRDNAAALQSLASEND